MTKRKMPIRTDTIVLNGEYEGWECVARVNPPLKVFGDLASGEFDRIIAGLADVIVSWNFVDEAGNPLEAPSEETVALLPVDLATTLASEFAERVATVPPN